MVGPQESNFQNVEMKSDSFSDMVIDEMIAKIIQKDMLSDLRNKAKGIKDYVSDLENSR